MTMERKIGEIFEYRGEWYQCIGAQKNATGNLCKRCDMRCSFISMFKTPECRADFRSDGRYAIFKKLEKVGEPYLLYGHIVQRYAGVTTPVVLPKEPFAYYNAINNTVDIEVKQQNKNTENMETNEKTMPIPEGWEFDHLDERGNIVLKEKKKELPKTWLKCLCSINDMELIEEDSEIYKCSISELSDDGRLFGDSDRNMLPQGLGKPMLALCQLLVCRNAWWKQLGWKPDWTDICMKYCIGYNKDVASKAVSSFSNYILAFPTEDIRDLFLYTFRDLIEEAKELL